MEWVVVLPVKPLPVAKSRLERDDRAEVALAMATDTVAAAAGCAAVTAVVVVTDDERARNVLETFATVVPDEPDLGLNEAVAHGARVVAQRWPHAGVAVLTADLPALRADQLALALGSAAAVPRGLVADAAGRGTVLLTAHPGVALEPAFGDGSRDGHRNAGVTDLTDALTDAVPGLRRDVDTLDDLTAAQEIGLGPATSAALGESPHADPAPELQATVRSFAPGVGGLAVTDDGRWETLPADAQLVGFRVLHPGQRVRLARETRSAPTGFAGAGTMQITSMQITTITSQDRSRFA